MSTRPLDGPPRAFYDRADVAGSPCDLNEWISDVLGKIFGWTSGATIGTLFTIAKRGEPVGTDEFGNRYYVSRDTTSYDGRRRRWVVYNGYADARRCRRTGMAGCTTRSTNRRPSIRCRDDRGKRITCRT
jgi:NADH:ubiquinone oxidoreductase subunit